MILIDGDYNDLGFSVGNRLMVLYLREIEREFRIRFLYPKNFLQEKKFLLMQK